MPQVIGAKDLYAKALVMILAFAASMAGSSCQEYTAGRPESETPAKARPKITISKETTFITEPLDADGYPDYVAALNRHCSREVTPENNAAVLFWKAFGPAKIDPDRRAQHFKLLGIAPLPAEGEYFRTSDRQVEIHETQPNSDPSEAGEHEPLYVQHGSTMQRPWSSEEFPIWAEWLKVNERPMELLVEASKRSRRFDPWFHYKDEDTIDVAMPVIYQYREAVRAFTARAMLRIQEGKVNEAWEDLLTCHRLARLVGQGPTFVESLVAITLEGMALWGDRALVEHAKLPAERIAAMQRELDALPPLLDSGQVLHFGKRLSYLSRALTAAKKSSIERNLFLEKLDTVGTTDRISIFHPILDVLGDSEIDWNVTFRLGNTWFDRFVEASRKPLPLDRRNAVKEIEKDILSLTQTIKDVNSINRVSREELHKVCSERIAQAFVILYIPALCTYNTAIDRSSMNSDLTRLAFALAQYRADNGSYPEKLAILTQKYIDEIPKDIFNNDADLHYVREGEGYMLYSVGMNGGDDGGKGPGDNEDDLTCDDIVVRVPVRD